MILLANFSAFFDTLWRSLKGFYCALPPLMDVYTGKLAQQEVVTRKPSDTPWHVRTEFVRQRTPIAAKPSAPHRAVLIRVITRHSRTYFSPVRDPQLLPLDYGWSSCSWHWVANSPLTTANGATISSTTDTLLVFSVTMGTNSQAVALYQWHSLLDRDLTPYAECWG